MKRIIVSVLLLLPSLTLQAADKIRISGSTSVLPIVAEVSKQYRALHPQLKLLVSGGGSGAGVADISKGASEIAMVSRDLSSHEKQRLQNKVRQVAVARDAVAVAISSEVYEAGVRQLSLEQIAGIYRGKIKNWQQVGGPDARILVIDKEPSRGTRHVFAKVVLGSAKARAPGASIVTGSNNEEQAAIANSAQAIGMLSNAWLNDDVRAVAVGEPGRAVLPTRQNIADGSYPIQRNLNLLLVKEPNPRVAAFVDYLLSEEGQRIVEQTGYLPVH